MSPSGTGNESPLPLRRPPAASQHMWDAVGTILVLLFLQAPDYNIRPDLKGMEMAPIVNQPQCHTTTRSFEWQTGLCDCGSNCCICWCGACCFFCLGCKVAEEMNECCCCGTSVAMRTRYRTLYRIPGSICSDCLAVTFCAPCNICQLQRDIIRRQELGIF